MQKRSEYMDNHTSYYEANPDATKAEEDAFTSKAHREYFAQFVNEPVKGLIRRSGKLDAIKASKDRHLNDVPLKFWDRLSTSIPQSARALMREAGEGWSLGSGVCVLKEAARQVVEES